MLILRVVLTFVIACIAAQSHSATNERSLLALLKSFSFSLYAKDEKGMATTRSCIGFTAAESKNKEIVFYLAAGHCHDVHYLRLQGGEAIMTPLLGVVNDRGAYDFLYSFFPNCIKREILLPEFTEAKIGGEYYTFGQVEENDAIARPELAPLVGSSFKKLGLVTLTLTSIDEDVGLRFSQVCPTEGCIYRTTPGISGAPIIDNDGRVVAIFRGFLDFRPEVPLGVSLTHVLPILRSAARANHVTFEQGRYCTTTFHH